MKNPKYYRIIVTYSGFSDTKDTAIMHAAKYPISQDGYDPVEGKRTIDYVFNSARAAASCRLRLVEVQKKLKGFSVSKVIDDNF